jgi:hypothetical protein
MRGVMGVVADVSTRPQQFRVSLQSLRTYRRRFVVAQQPSDRVARYVKYE